MLKLKISARRAIDEILGYAEHTACICTSVVYVLIFVNVSACSGNIWWHSVGATLSPLAGDRAEKNER